MLKKMMVKLLALVWMIFIPICYAQEMDDGDNGVGQTIQINTRFHSFTGKPSWLLIIRDIDHNENIPYIFDIRRGTNFWVAFTYGRNYLISASTLQFSPYRRNPYRQKKINNFCQLESHGRIQRGSSLYITITGDLSPDTTTFTCHVSKYKDTQFTIVSPEE